MSTLQMLRALVDQRLTAAVEEIFVVLERTIAEYEAELCRTKEDYNQLLDAVFKKHQVVLHRTAAVDFPETLRVNTRPWTYTSDYQTSSRCQQRVMKRFPPSSRSGALVWDRRSYRPPLTLKRKRRNCGSSFKGWRRQIMKMKLSPYSFITVKVRRTEGRSL
ncbi:uncharacterized protein LOC133545477 isoform X4 [Nerophis ophidion]|uniref:uncharacterized protein LOC133545477 isoform X4 n=1 Tax=Nerophis ophidion TaxID=159077 RepID=UPI002ADF8E61|nr:uncharacterized protein LOC133545477 isoform X4 [Nerophis ophidion]